MVLTYVAFSKKLVFDITLHYLAYSCLQCSSYIISTACHPITSMLMNHPYSVIAASLIVCEEIVFLMIVLYILEDLQLLSILKSYPQTSTLYYTIVGMQTCINYMDGKVVHSILQHMEVRSWKHACLHYYTKLLQHLITNQYVLLNRSSFLITCFQKKSSQSTFLTQQVQFSQQQHS